MNRDNVVRAFMVAAILISLKAFYLDDYLKDRALKKELESIEPHLTQVNEKKETKFIDDATDKEKEDRMVRHMEGNATKKMPLDELGDKMSKHIKL